MNPKLITLILLSSCSYFSVHRQPSPGNLQTQINHYDAVAGALSKCPKDGVLWIKPTHQYFKHSAVANYPLENRAYGKKVENFYKAVELPNKMGSIIYHHSPAVDAGVLIPKEKSVKRCKILITPSYDYRYQYDIASEVRSFPYDEDGIPSYVYTLPNSIYDSNSKRVEFPTKYHGKVEGITTFPHSTGWNYFSFLVYLASAFEGKIIAEGIADESLDPNKVLGELILLKDQASHIFVRYYQPKSLESGERKYLLDTIYIEATFYDPIIKYDWHKPNGKVAEAELKLEYLTPQNKMPLWSDYLRRINKENEVHAKFAEADRKYRQDNWQEIQRIEESHRRNKMPETNLGKEIAETLQKNNEFYESLDRSTQETRNNIDMMRSSQKSSYTSTTTTDYNSTQPQSQAYKEAVKNMAEVPKAIAIGDTNKKHEEMCGHYGKQSEFFEGRWRCVDQKSAAPKKVETEERVEAMAYCYPTQNNRWLCHSPANKMTVSHATLAEAEKAGTCNYRSKMAINNGHAYFCNRPQESFDEKVYDIYELHGVAGQRKHYICDTSKSVSECKSR
jgi:hypothetical protein